MTSKRLPTLYACIVAVSVVSGAGAAQTQDLADLSLEQLMELKIDSVVGASKYEQRVTQAPSSISIVTADEIRRFGYTTLAEVLRSVRGMYVADDRNYTYFGLRGFLRPGDYGSRVLVLIDGHRLNENIYDSGSVGRDAMVDVELIDRVEVIRGPSSSLYGSSAVLGVINVITRRGRQIDGVEIAANAASLDTFGARATYGAAFDNGVEWLVSASDYSSHGADRLYYPEFDQRIADNPRATGDGVARGLDDEDASKLFSSLRYGDLSAAAYYSTRTKQIPTASFGTIFGDGGQVDVDERGYLELQYARGLGDAMRLQVRGFYDHYAYEGSFPNDEALPGDPADRVLFRDRAVGEWFGTELQVTAQLHDRYTLVFGGEHRYNVHEDQYSYADIEPRDYSLRKQSSSNFVGLFAQGEAVLRDDLRFTAGLRCDRYGESFGNTINPRAALIYNPSPRSALKALYGEAFRAPNPFERFYSPAQRTRAPLRPETIRTQELVYEHYLGSRYRLNLSGYHYDIRGLITQAETPDGEQYYANIDDAHALGIEAELEARYASGVIMRVSYAAQRAEDTATGVDLSNSPHRLATLNLSGPLPGGALMAALELQHHGSSRTLTGRRSPDFLLTNVTLGTHELWRGVELSAGICNLFDARQVYPASEEHLQDTLQLDGRTYRGKIVVRF